MVLYVHGMSPQSVLNRTDLSLEYKAERFSRVQSVLQLNTWKTKEKQLGYESSMTENASSSIMVFHPLLFFVATE